MGNSPEVGIIMGSDSDLPVMKKALDVLKEFDVEYEVRIISAHRTPDIHAEYAKTALGRGLKVIIAGAGMAAHLPGVTAGNTILPVIGVPLAGKSLDGIDALYSILQMPPGVPVAAVAIDGAKNAALLAVRILAVSNNNLAEKLKLYKLKMAEESVKKNEKLSDL